MSVLIGHKFYGHLSNIANDQNIHITLREFAKFVMPFCLGGATGVIVFFLVSGYIITQVLTKESTSSFIIKRIFRIYPLYIFAVLLEIILGHIVHGIPMPSIKTLIPQLTLTGDFFATPYTLAGVEWTLRIEILFYLLMVLLKTKVWRRDNARSLPALFFLITVLLQAFGPFATHSGWSNGYITLYMPFLFMGSIVFLLEKQLIHRNFGIFCMLYIGLSYLVLLPKINPSFSNSHAMIIACSLFAATWVLKNKFTSSFFIIFASDLTYAVYLFHNWLWGYIELLIKNFHTDNTFLLTEITFMLFAFCYFAHITVEKTGIKMGAYIKKKTHFVKKIKITTKKFKFAGSQQ